jgi:hypothetical protein
LGARPSSDLIAAATSKYAATWPIETKDSGNTFGATVAITL